MSIPTASEAKVNDLLLQYADDLGDRNFQEIAACAKRVGLNRVAPIQVIVGGTNGKGSTATFLQEILTSQGYRVGLTTSPHLLSYLERISIDGSRIADDKCLEAIAAIGTQFRGIRLSYFDWTTLAALEYFRKEQVEVAVIEVGLGGRLDSANVIDPDLAILTNVALDHQDRLGNTVAEIAKEKCPICRQGITLVYGDYPGEATVFEYVEEHDIPLVQYGREYGNKEESISWITVDGEIEELTTDSKLRPLQSSLVTAMQASVLLDNSITSASLEAIELEPQRGRFQWIKAIGQTWLLDGAHNVSGIRYLLNALYSEEIYECNVVFGCREDKDIFGMLRELTSSNREYPVKVRNLHYIDKEEIASSFLKEQMDIDTGGQGIYLHDSLSKAIEWVAHQSTNQIPTVVCGSIRLIGEVLTYLNSKNAKESCS